MAMLGYFSVKLLGSPIIYVRDMFNSLCYFLILL